MFKCWSDAQMNQLRCFMIVLHPILQRVLPFCHDRWQPIVWNRLSRSKSDSNQWISSLSDHVETSFSNCPFSFVTWHLSWMIVGSISNIYIYIGKKEWSHVFTCYSCHSHIQRLSDTTKIHSIRDDLAWRQRLLLLQRQELRRHGPKPFIRLTDLLLLVV